LVVGNDGGAYRYRFETDGDDKLDNANWFEGDNDGFSTLLPYFASVAEDGTVWAGLQDNGNLRVDPTTRRQFETYGGDGFFTAVDPDDSKTSYEEYVAAAMSVTEDGGRSWRSIDPELTAAKFSTPFAMDGYHATDRQLSQLDAKAEAEVEKAERAEESERAEPETSARPVRWKSVGDVAYADDEGYLHISDRKTDMIISGGVNIYPAEIEAVLYAHPQILDAAVLGVADDEWGERVYAIVQAKPGETLDTEELAAFVAERVASYKRPRAYEVRDALPRTESGKLLKRVLRDELRSRASAS